MEEAKKDVFDGLLITAFGGAVVGPLTMKFFADHGATVIRIESIKRPCTLRTGGPYKEGKPGINRAGYFNFYNGIIFSNTISGAGGFVLQFQSIVTLAGTNTFTVANATLAV